jgi:hypothetical protein
MFSHRPEVILGVFAVMGLTACRPAIRYDDDVDIVAAKRDFQCTPAPGAPAKADACRILDDFANAQTFAAWPASGVEVWYGRAHCSAEPEDVANVNWAAVAFQPGAEPVSTPGSNAKTDPSRAIPSGVFTMISRTSNMVIPDGRVAQQRLLDAAMHGTHPDFSDLPSMKASYDDIWSRLHHPPPGSYVSLSKSTGVSVLESALDTNAEGSAALRYLRAKDNRLLIVQPARPVKSTPPPETCVAELWKTVP